MAVSAVADIKNAVERLVQKKPYASIRIQDVCEEAGISRKTFSKWFCGVDDVVRACIVDDFADPVRNVNAELPLNTIQSAISIMLEKHYQRFYDRKDFYLPIAKGKGVAWLAEQISDVMERLNLEILTEVDWMDEEDLEFGAFFLSSSHAAILTWWIKQNLSTSIPDLARLTEKWLYAHQRELDTGNKRW